MRYALLTVFLFLSGLAQAEPVSLVSGEDYAPYADSKLPEGGMTTDLVRKAFAEMKLEVKVDWQPWARGYEEARNGQFAGTYPYIKTAEREKDFLYSAAIISLQERAFTRSGNKKFDFENVASLIGTTICLPLGWAPTPKLAEMIKTEKIKTSSPTDFPACVKMVAMNRADYFITDETLGLAALKASGTPPGSVVMADGPALSDNSLYLIASKSLPGSKDILATFNKGLEALRKNGTYKKTVKAHTK